MEPEKNNLGSQVVTAIVFTGIVTGILVAAKLAQSPAEASDGGPAALSEQELKGPPPNSLTPETARNARELHAALLAKFGNNWRGQTFITHVDYDAHPDRLHVSFPLDEADVTAPTAKAGGLKRARDILEAVRGTRMHWTWVLITGTAPAKDVNGTPSDSTVIRVQVARERLSGLEWDRFTGDNVPEVAEQLWFHPELARPLPPEPTSQPATTAPAAD